MSDDLQSLEQRRDELLLRREIATLEAETGATELLSKRVTEGFGDVVSRRGYLDDGQGLSDFGLGGASRISRPEDKKQGDNYPHWRTETELSGIRGRSRFIAQTDEVAISALENLANYILGDGLTLRATPQRRHANNPQAREAARVAQSLIDAFVADNEWTGDLERETFERWRRDGEFHLGLWEKQEKVEAILIDPDFVTEPEKPRALEDYLRLDSGLDWKYGHASDWRNPGQAKGYFVSWFGDEVDWDFLPPERCVHAKLNVDREVKRGLSDFYSVEVNLEKAGKLLENTLIGASVQSAIAYIREHAPGTTSDGISSFVKNRADVSSTTSTPNGSRTRNGRRINPGTVVDVKGGAKYHAGPLGQARSNSYIDLVQAALRLVGVRWQMPEYLISGDASNGNFASVLVAEAPFTKSSGSKQATFSRSVVSMLWKILGVYSRAGVLPPMSRLRKWLDLTANGPEIAVRDRLEDHTIRKEENAAGILSLDTWSTEAGRDLEDEIAKGATPSVAESGRVPVGENDPPSDPPDETPVDQPNPGDDVLPDNIKTTAALNGAQIAAVLEVLAQLRGGEIAEAVAVAMIQAVGVDTAEAESIVSQQAAHNRANPPATSDPLPTISESWRGYP